MKVGLDGEKTHHMSFGKLPKHSAKVGIEAFASFWNIQERSVEVDLEVEEVHRTVCHCSSLKDKKRVPRASGNLENISRTSTPNI